MTKKIITSYCLVLALFLILGAASAHASEVTGTLSTGVTTGTGTSGTIGGTVGGGSGGGGGGGTSGGGGGSSGGGGGGFLATPGGQVLGASTGPSDPGLPNAGFAPGEEETSNGTENMLLAGSIIATCTLALFAIEKKKLSI